MAREKSGGGRAVNRTVVRRQGDRQPEAGVKLVKGDCIPVMRNAPDECVDLIFADPPYFLSNNGVTCHAGRMVSVNKGKWDTPKGAVSDHEFVKGWLSECQRLLKRQ